MVSIIVPANRFPMSGAALSETIAIENSKGKVPIVIKADDVVMAEVPEIDEDKPEKVGGGRTYGAFYTKADQSLKVNSIVLQSNLDD